MALTRNLKRRLATGSNATLVTLLLIGIAVVGYAILEPFRVRVDFTSTRSSTLMEDTRNKLRLLEKDGIPVKITAFSAQEGKQEAYFKNRQLEDLVDELDYASPIVESKFVDFDRDRLTAENLGVTEYGTVVIQRGDQRVDIHDRDLFHREGKGADRSLSFLGESTLNRGFSQLMTNSTRVIYALVGHGEMDPESHAPDGIADLAKALDQEHYEVKRLDLVRGNNGEVPRVPDDAAAVMVLRPKVPIPVLEQDLLLAYLATGGPLLLSVEPKGVIPELFGRFGIGVPEGLVLDKYLVFPFPDRPVPRYKSHPITQALADDMLVTVLSGVAPLQAAVPPREGVRASTLLETSRDGWIERGGELKGGNAVFQPEIDAAGPVSMAMALEIGQDSGLVKRGVGRVVVVGDSDLFANNLLTEGPGNLSFAVNACRWLVGDDGRLSVSGRPANVRKLALTDEDLAQLRWVVIGLGPLLAIIVGAAVWSSRRGR